MREQFLAWAVAKYYREQGYQVRMGRIQLDHSEVDGEATREGERIAIEVKTPHDDLIRGIGQLAIAAVYGYSKCVLVTTRKNGKRIDKKVFQHYGFECWGVDGWGKVHNLLSHDEA